MTVAVTLALAWPLAATAWYDVPVRAKKSTIKLLQDDDIDTAALAGKLRIAADRKDPGVKEAKESFATLCPRCRWEPRTGAQGDYIWVWLASDDSGGELDSVPMPMTAKKRATPRGSSGP